MQPAPLKVSEPTPAIAVTLIPNLFQRHITTGSMPPVPLLKRVRPAAQPREVQTGIIITVTARVDDAEPLTPR